MAYLTWLMNVLEVTLMSVSKAGCPHVALCSRPGPLGLSLRSVGQHTCCCSTGLCRLLISSFFSLIVRVGTFYFEFTCLFCHLISAVGSLWYIFHPGLCNFNSRAAIWFFLIISVSVDILYLLSHFTMFFFNYLNTGFLHPFEHICDYFEVVVCCLRYLS